ncbi:hypothetical protein V8B97DRAFT_1845276, partial [Scleroderma yunnanense]
ESPIKSLYAKVAPIIALRLYIQSTSKVGPVQIGQNPAPWLALNASISPSKSSLAPIRTKTRDDVPMLQMMHKLILPLVFKALRPTTSKV